MYLIETTRLQQNPLCWPLPAVARAQAKGYFDVISL
jgi:hypothetical protein